MPLPDFTRSGDLPEGRHRASLDEVVARFGAGTSQRIAVTDRLHRIYDLAIASGSLDRLVVFGSYVSDVDEPNDIDVILVMRNDLGASRPPTRFLDDFCLYRLPKGHQWPFRKLRRRKTPEKASLRSKKRL